MGQCEFIEKCPFFLGKLAEKPGQIEELKENYCESNNLNCARYMIAQSVGKEHMPADLYPDEKIVAYQVIAENS